MEPVPWYIISLTYSPRQTTGIFIVQPIIDRKATHYREAVTHWESNPGTFRFEGGRATTMRYRGHKSLLIDFN